MVKTAWRSGWPFLRGSVIERVVATGQAVRVAHNLLASPATRRSWLARTTNSTPAARSATNKSYKSASRSPILTKVVLWQALRMVLTAKRLVSHLVLSGLGTGSSAITGAA